MFFWRIVFALILVEIFALIALIALIGEIGFFAVFGLWLVSAFFGGWLMQEQGMATLNRAQASLNRGTLPMGDLFEGLCVFGAGALLIMPGFISDIVALALLVPSFRNLVRTRGAKTFGLKEENMRASDDGVIDGVYERVPERTEQIMAKNPEN